MEQVKQQTTRFSGADWYTEKRDIMLIGCGGIGSFLAINLARIGHNLYLIDMDSVDETNVTGGQAYRTQDVGIEKVFAIQGICREMGCTSMITPINEPYSSDNGMLDICITALDNMDARKLAFREWEFHLKELKAMGGDLSGALFMDGRLLMENMEILCIQGDNKEQIEKYRKEYLFNDEDVEELDCTTKQSTFGAMIIAGMMTATLCNWLTNRKLEMDFRSVPFYNRYYLPIFENKQINIEQHEEKSILV